MFAPFVDYLFELKKNGVKEVKKYLNALAGKLCEKNLLDINDNKIKDDKIVFMAQPKSNKKGKPVDFTYSVFNNERIYETDFARMHPFLVASGRLMISNMVRQNLESTVRCYVDGLILSGPIKNVKLGTDIGDLKFEGKGSCDIINSRDYKFNFENKMA
jgi:hypothetical protein